MDASSCARRRSGRILITAAVAVLVAAAAVLAGCSGDGGEAGGGPRGKCPVTPVSVVATIGPWGSIAGELAGDCADVTTIVTGSKGDPHDFEPSPSDRAAIEAADVVITNGLGYDAWAADALESASSDPAVVVAGEVTGMAAGDNPHAWYDPAVVREAAVSITQALQDASPSEAEEYLTSRFQDWERSLAPYDAAIERIRGAAAGRPYAATEAVFDPMAAALGLVDVTPAGYAQAVSNRSEASPADVAELEQLLAGRSASVLIANAQTSGPLSRQLTSLASRSGVPVVEVTETGPSGSGSFVGWQVSQLDALAASLGV